MELARRTDPFTSQLRALAAKHGGKTQIQRLRCLVAVLLHPGLTGAELAVSTGMERHAPSRRLPELREKGQVCNGPSRRCSVTGRLSLVWLPAEEK